MINPLIAGGGQFTPYSAGVKRYGAAGSTAATIGPVDPAGYLDRDAQKKVQMAALQQALNAKRTPVSPIQTPQIQPTIRK